LCLNGPVVLLIIALHETWHDCLTNRLCIIFRAIGKACRLESKPRAAVEKARGAAMVIEVAEGRLLSRCGLAEVVQFDDSIETWILGN
jgi:hypothetical protein